MLDFLHTEDNIRTYLLVYVDDILIASKSMTTIQKIKTVLSSIFLIRDLGDAKFFLRMQTYTNTRPYEQSSQAVTKENH
jgi:GR25 family glycosyltransferase involved in LPS biosynthesis